MIQEATRNPFETDDQVPASMHREADQIQEYMSRPVHLQDPASLTYRLNDLDVYMARLTDMMIRSKAMRDRVQNRFVLENEDKLNKMTATAANRLINSRLLDYTTAYARLDAMYHTIEHLTRDLVTQISYIKQQMQARL